MANEKSLLLALEGNYVSGTLTGEIWATTFRFALVFGSIDDIGTFPNNWDVGAQAVGRTETLWTIDGNWFVSGPGVGNVFNADDWLNDQVAPAVTAFFAASTMAGRAQVNTLKAYPIASPTGKSIPAPGFTQGTPMTLTWTASNPTGSEGGEMLPPQDSLVVSNRSNQTGRKGRGRNYWPAPSVNIMSSGVASAGACNNLAAAQATLLSAMQVSAGAGLANVKPVITGKPFVNYGVIDSVNVGNVVDTQQRRRDRLVEVRYPHAVTY